MNNQPNYDMAMGFLQTFDVLLNLNQVSNDTLLEELQKQNKEYLEKIVKQNETIIEQNKEILANQQINLEHVVIDNQNLHNKVDEIVDAQIDLSDAILGRGSYYLKHIQKKHRGG